MEEWLNDTSIDGFLGNLREPDKFIKVDSVWNATMTSEITKPLKTTLVTDAVGLLNSYEYAMTFKTIGAIDGYLRNMQYWYLLTPYNDTNITYIDDVGAINMDNDVCHTIRPAINLKGSVKIVKGLGTADEPYILQGDNDNPISTLLSTRYSGEYISFGTGENNLYRIVSHENGTGTKITSAIPLKDSGSYKKLAFGSNLTFSKDNTIGTFLNGDYLTNGTYLTSDQVNMIEDNTTWYLGNILSDDFNYKTVKDITGNTVTSKIGLLRVGELLTGQDDFSYNTVVYWLLNMKKNTEYGYGISGGANMYINVFSSNRGIKPSMNLKANVVITGGDGTKNNPFTVKLGS